MNVLYKYCDQLGIVKILGSLELKLPYISEVNDPLECLPVFQCSDTSEEEKHQKIQEEWKKRTLLLSVSRTAQNTVMWSHYAEKHKGAVIGINFTEIKVDPIIIPQPVKYPPVDHPNERPVINFPDGDWNSILFTKSRDWSYEEELREIFTIKALETLQESGSACLKDFNGRPTWFLRLNPESIREVIFGLYTEESLKSAIRKLIQRAELQHVKLYQAEESETYILNLIDIGNQ